MLYGRGVMCVEANSWSRLWFHFLQLRPFCNNLSVPYIVFSEETEWILWPSVTALLSRAEPLSSSLPHPPTWLGWPGWQVNVLERLQLSIIAWQNTSDLICKMHVQLNSRKDMQGLSGIIDFCPHPTVFSLAQHPENRVKIVCILEVLNYQWEIHLCSGSYLISKCDKIDNLLSNYLNFFDSTVIYRIWKLIKLEIQVLNCKFQHNYVSRLIYITWKSIVISSITRYCHFKYQGQNLHALACVYNLERFHWVDITLNFCYNYWRKKEEWRRGKSEQNVNS